MIRTPAHRALATVVAAAALLAAACEIEPISDAVPETIPPLQGGPHHDEEPGESEQEPPEPGHPASHGAPAPTHPPKDGEATVPPVPKDPTTTTAAPATTVPATTTTAAPTTTVPATTTTMDHTGGSGGSGMPHVDRAAIPSGSGGRASALVGPTTLTALTDDIQGALVMVCRFSHMNFDDAIVFPGVRHATHLHAYFGNTGANFASTPESIGGSGNSTCLGGTANRSSYWVPALIDTRDGTPLEPTEMVTYYTHGRVPGPEIQPHPAGLRILAGNARSTGAQQHVRWWCPGDHGHYESYISPNCNGNEELKLSVTFPQCWNGRDTHSPDQSHMAYPGWNTGCPSSHPIAVPQVNLNVIWHLDGQTPSTLRLSSDMYSHDVPGGYSGHADWFDGWDREILETWVSECVNRSVYCFGGNLGNGQALQRP